jgi:type IV pilus biogenesis protein CpaD/CtpE
MTTKPIRWLALAALPLLAACEHDLVEMDGHPASTFGEANRQTMAAQVVDPDPQYEYLDPATSGEHAAQAIDKYRKGAVTKPERVSSTTVR